MSLQHVIQYSRNLWSCYVWLQGRVRRVSSFLDRKGVDPPAQPWFKQYSCYLIVSNELLLEEKHYISGGEELHFQLALITERAMNTWRRRRKFGCANTFQQLVLQMQSWCAHEFSWMEDRFPSSPLSQNSVSGSAVWWCQFNSQWCQCIWFSSFSFGLWLVPNILWLAATYTYNIYILAYFHEI